MAKPIKSSLLPQVTDEWVTTRDAVASGRLDSVLHRWAVEDLVWAGYNIPSEDDDVGGIVTPEYFSSITPGEELTLGRSRNNHAVGVNTFVDRESNSGDALDLQYWERERLEEFRLPQLKGLDFVTNVGKYVTAVAGKPGSWVKQDLLKREVDDIDWYTLKQNCLHAVLNWVDILDFEMSPKRACVWVYLSPYLDTDEEWVDYHPSLSAWRVAVFGKIVDYVDALTDTGRICKYPDGRLKTPQGLFVSPAGPDVSHLSPRL